MYDAFAAVKLELPDRSYSFGDGKAQQMTVVREKWVIIPHGSFLAVLLTTHSQGI